MNQALSALERTVLPGTRLGRYEIITHLASGGMATVFLGRALGVAGFHRLVAIKLLHPHVAADQQFITMFLDEARLAARIRHPNVVATVDLQNGPEGHYLVMEFIEGESLLGLLRQTVKMNRPMPAGIAIRIVLDALAGLHAAHELRGDLGESLNLVHRDVSPHNILVGVDGIARIVDFGIARAEERIGTTRDGQVKGKLAYMAPEQTSGENVDRRVDVFTAGIVLWETLTGRRLFRGQTDAEVLRNLLDKPILRLREVSPAYPQALDDVCARALNRDRDERFDSTADFAEALEEAAEPLGIATSKQVSAYVRDVAGELIDGVMARARAFQEGVKVKSAPPPRLELGENADSSIRSSTPLGASLTEPEVTRSRRPLVVGVAAAVLVLLGAIIATVTLLIMSQRGAPDAHATQTAAAQTTAQAMTTAPITTAADSSESISITDLPKSGAERAGHPIFPRHGVPIPPPPPSTTPSATVKPTATAPVSSVFNPESM